MSRNPERREKRFDDPLEYLNYCLGLEKNFEVAPRVLAFELRTEAVNKEEQVGVRDIAVSTAYQCYAPGITEMKRRDGEKAEAVADSTLDAGHHTTRMHSHYTWKLMVTRNVIHEFFNQTEYSNTNQQSQRYALVKEGNYLVPAGLQEKQRALFLETANFANRSYSELIKLLEVEVNERLSRVPIYANNEKKRGEKAGKMTQEVARYVLPIDQFSVMDYTLNELQLLRMFRASQLPHVSDEARYVVAKMIQTVAEHDPQILEDLRKPVEAEREYGWNSELVSGNKKEFDQKLEGRRSKLLGFDPASRETMAFAVRNVLGVPQEELPDDQAIIKVLDPAKNPLLADVFETGLVDPLTRTMKVVHFTFADKMSHTADSQRQRQRATPGATPPLLSQFDGTVDVATPKIIEENSELKEWYETRMIEIVTRVNRCIEAGIPRELAISLLPNGYNVRLIESGDMLGYFHRRKSRLCLNAQEEISENDLEQSEQMIAVFPETRLLLKAPCGVRKAAGETPPCPEGDRFCGHGVWRLNDISDYREERTL